MLRSRAFAEVAVINEFLLHILPLYELSLFLDVSEPAARNPIY